MSKDGTFRGGYRPGAGRKKKDLAERIEDGETSVAKWMNPPELVGTDIDSNEMPPPSAYLSAMQYDNGKPFFADKVYEETWKWLKARECEKLVNKNLLEAYSQHYARWVQCEMALNEYGLIGKHPTTKMAMASPFVDIGQKYQKQATLLWYEIYGIVKENCTTKFDSNPNDDMMETLLGG